ncbi:YbjQ family protein [Herbivorax sp. ANBcel31]|uniref:YbjQ family protein n=1 Tax=Herbivorax sp. ANBcel31 TaxID=3069754 RepID=UPI0027AEC1F6|nr:YbjQ family protein [Herbivorax sp. ANBcel31]MDQ2087035.1 YbjQ family protein [Herbivorax sp. ANBcel31]
MILVNTDFISGKEVETLSIVKGSTIQTKHVGRDFMSGLKTIVGGELKGYVEMINHARALATKRMVQEAEKLGADAIINVRYSTSNVMQGAAEILVYGTAVKFR